MKNKATSSANSTKTIKGLVEREIDIYELLGITKDYEDVDLEASHDIKNIEEGSRQFKADVTLAYSILKNPKQKKIYEMLWEKQGAKEKRATQEVFFKKYKDYNLGLVNALLLYSLALLFVLIATSLEDNSKFTVFHLLIYCTLFVITAKRCHTISQKQKKRLNIQEGGVSILTNTIIMGVLILPLVILIGMISLEGLLGLAENEELFLGVSIFLIFVLSIPQISSIFKE